VFVDTLGLICRPPQVGGPDEYQSLEKSEVVREGTDVSIFTYSRMRYVVMQAVAELEKKGYNPEVGGRAGIGARVGVGKRRDVSQSGKHQLR
jgi:hypothetical protein